MLVLFLCCFDGVGSKSFLWTEMSRDTYATHFETRAWLFILASSREGGYLRYSMTLFSRTTLVRVATRSQTMNSEPGRNEIETPMAASQMWAWICVTHTHVCCNEGFGRGEN